MEVKQEPNDFFNEEQQFETEKQFLPNETATEIWNSEKDNNPISCVIKPEFVSVKQEYDADVKTDYSQQTCIKRESEINQNFDVADMSNLDQTNDIKQSRIGMGDYEKEQQRLEKLLNEVLSEETENTESVLYDDEEEETEDHIDIHEENSDTEQEFEPDDDLQEDCGPCFIGKDKETQWKKHVPPKNLKTRAKNVINMSSVPPNMRQLKEPLDIFRQFFDADIVNMIVAHTNEYLRSVADQYGRQTYTRETNNLEIEALLGLLLLAGVKKSNHLNAEDLFKTNGTAPEIYRLAMSLQRFRILLRFLRFDDIESRKARRILDKLASIRELFDRFVSNCKANFNPSQMVTVDEKLEAFRGRCGFRQYMPRKPNKYGIKIFALCDAKIFYTSNLEVYVGNQPEGPFSQNNSAQSVVERLCEPYYGSNRNVTTDRWFTSIDLAENLLSNGLTTIGTIRANKKELPPEFVQKNARPIGSSMFGFRNNCTLVSYLPKKNKNVLLISTFHDDDKLDDQTGKPEIIIDYNQTKCGVDVVDQLCSNYNCARLTGRWQLVIFYTLLNVAGINSFVIYTANNNGEKVRRHFLEKLSFSLIDAHLRVRATISTLPISIKLRICEICKICKIEAPEEQPKETRKLLGRCVPCGSKKNRKTKFSCKKCKKFLCLEHVSFMCAECYNTFSI